MSSTASSRAVSAQLARMVNSREFSNTARLRQFLRYVVEETLAGRRANIKGYTIGVDVYKRAVNYDPDKDAIVRVEAGRLRKLLADYYSGSGKDDPVLIEIPRGSYVPHFSIRHDTGSQDDNLKSDPPPHIHDSLLVRLNKTFESGPLTGSMALATIAILLILTAISIRHEYLAPHIDPLTLYDSKKATVDRPSVAVTLFSAEHIKPAGPALMARNISVNILDDLTRFKNLKVLSAFTNTLLNRNKNSGKYSNVDYILAGNIEQQKNNIEVTVRLLEARNGTVIWSKSYDRDIAADGRLAAQRAIASEVAATLGHPLGVIDHREWQVSKFRPLQALKPYDCYLRAVNYEINRSAKKHLQVRNCLEDALKRKPGFARGWAALANVYREEFARKFNHRPNSKPLDTALELAVRAVEIDPYDAYNHQALASIHFMRGDDEQAASAIARALEFNGNDANVLAKAAWIKAGLQDWSASLKLIRKAIRFHPGPPRWYGSILTFNYLQSEQYDKAYERIKASAQPNVAVPNLLLITAAQNSGRSLEARRLVKSLVAHFPKISTNYRRKLAALRLPAPIIEKISSSVEQAGLKPRPIKQARGY